MALVSEIKQKNKKLKRERGEKIGKQNIPFTGLYIVSLNLHI